MTCQPMPAPTQEPAADRDAFAMGAAEPFVKTAAAFALFWALPWRTTAILADEAMRSAPFPD